MSRNRGLGSFRDSRLLTSWRECFKTRLIALRYQSLFNVKNLAARLCSRTPKKEEGTTNDAQGTLRSLVSALFHIGSVSLSKGQRKISSVGIPQRVLSPNRETLFSALGLPAEVERALYLRRCSKRGIASPTQRTAHLPGRNPGGCLRR